MGLFFLFVITEDVDFDDVVGYAFTVKVVDFRIETVEVEVDR